jgi:hypothetical protein
METGSIVTSKSGIKNQPIESKEGRPWCPVPASAHLNSKFHSREHTEINFPFGVSVCADESLVNPRRRMKRRRGMGRIGRYAWWMG